MILSHIYFKFVILSQILIEVEDKWKIQLIFRNEVLIKSLLY